VRRAAKVLFLAMTAVGVLLLFVFPARTLLDQRHQISTTESHIASLRRENTQLSSRIKSLSDPTQIEQIAHQQYGLVIPGQKAYTITPKVQPKAKPSAAKRPAAKTHHWWQDLEFWR
jgi:cell division protein FtsL